MCFRHITELLCHCVRVQSKFSISEELSMMSSIVTGILSSTVGLLWNKARSSAADKLKDGDVTDVEIRKIVVRELDDIKSKIDGLSRSTLLVSYDFLQEGVDLLSASLDKSNPEQRAREVEDELGQPSSGIQSDLLNQAIALPHSMGKLKINSEADFKAAKERFNEARKAASNAFRNDALSIEDRIFAAKLRIVSDILEHFDSPETAITGCLSFLKKFHSLPAIQEILSVYLDGGVKSLLNKTKRVENVKSVMLINYVLFQYVWKFSNKYSLEVSASMPTIELHDRSFHPIKNWYEISDRNSMGNELKLQTNEVFFKETMRPFLSAVNSQGDILIFPDFRPYDLDVFLMSGKFKRVKFPQDVFGVPAALAVDMNDNVYVLTWGGPQIKFRLFIFDENYNAKAEHKLDLFISGDSFRMAICKNNDIVFIKDENDGFVYVCDKRGKLKYKFETEPSEAVSLSISPKNEIMIPTEDHTAVQIFTMEGNLTKTIKVPEDHEILSVAFHYVICKILVLTFVKEKGSHFLIRYPEAGGEMENIMLLGSKMDYSWHSRIKSHPNGFIVVVKDQSAIYL